jgi:hypothetical protein
MRRKGIISLLSSHHSGKDENQHSLHLEKKTKREGKRRS